MQRILMGAVALVAVGVASVAPAADFGVVKGRFVLDGAAPVAAKLNINKDVQFCGPFNLLDEAVVVNPNDAGLANVVVMLSLARGEKAPAAPAEYVEAAKEPVKFLNERCRFAPHIAVVQVGQTVLLGNADQVGHNVKLDTFANPPINPIIPAGGELKHTFSMAERLPAKASCSIHPWMTGWVVVTDHPFAVVSDESGQFELKMPVGKWGLVAWQEKAGYVREVSRGGKKEEWSRGRFEVTVAKDATTDLGEIKVPVALFK